MSADLLREAAATMRERAEAATPSPWEAEDYSGNGGTAQVFSWSASWPTVDRPLVPADAEHIASWHPAVALAVADLLDAEADAGPCEGDREWVAAVSLARAYLGRDS